MAQSNVATVSMPMKNILLFAFLSILFFSCGENQAVTEQMNRGNAAGIKSGQCIRNIGEHRTAGRTERTAVRPLVHAVLPGGG